MRSFSAAIATPARAASPCAARAIRRSRTQIDFSELNEDDLVVHLEHGIGRYEGMKSIPRGRWRRDRGGARRRLCRRRAALRAARAELPRLALRRRREKQSAALDARRRQVGEGEEERGESRLRLRGQAARRARRARDRAGLRLSAGQQVAARIRGVVSLQGNARPAHRHRRDQGRHGERAARWIGSSAATSASAKPRSRSAPRSRR